jgi:phosphotransferase system enzyme I (PtsI)
LARVCDFVAIGTNDLIQYTLAIDRADDQMAELYDPLHPAVLRLIRTTVEAGERASIPVSVCGEMAGDTRLAPLLLGLGVKELSMAPASIPLVKERLSSVSLKDLSRKATTALQLDDPTQIRMMLNDFSELS